MNIFDKYPLQFPKIMKSKIPFTLGGKSRTDDHRELSGEIGINYK
jgi:hypothetical protein